MGWDIGARGITDELAAMHNVARVCAWWTLVAGAVVIVVRYWKFEGRWFILTGAALLQVALHGLAGVSYLLAGLIAVAVAAIAIAISYMTRSRAHPSERNMRAIAIVLGACFAFGQHFCSRSSSRWSKFKTGRDACGQRREREADNQPGRTSLFQRPER